MKKALVIAGVIAAAAIGLGLGAKKVHFEGEVSGCKKTALYQLEQQYGEAPDDIKTKVLASLDVECRKIL